MIARQTEVCVTFSHDDDVIEPDIKLISKPLMVINLIFNYSY